jgi:hypothetical protein
VTNVRTAHPKADNPSVQELTTIAAFLSPLGFAQQDAIRPPMDSGVEK